MTENVELQLMQLSRKLHHRLNRKFDALIQTYGVTFPQLMILEEINLHSQRISDLALTLNMTCSNLSLICRRLEKAGLLERTRRLEDQRNVELQLTGKAQKLLELVQIKMNEDSRHLCEKIDPEQLKAILDGFSSLNQILSKE